MVNHLDLLTGSFPHTNSRFHGFPNYLLISPQQQSFSYRGKHAMFKQFEGKSTKPVDHTGLHSALDKLNNLGEATLNVLPCVQTLRKIPEELSGKTVMVRIEADVLLRAKKDQNTPAVSRIIATIKYLYASDAKIILLGHWSETINSKIPTVEFVAEYVSLVLQLKVLPRKLFPDNLELHMEHNKDSVILLDNLYLFKEERANCLKFSKYLSSGVDIFVNDAFSLCHRVLASTVGVASFCCSRVAGFHFEGDLCELKEAVTHNKKPYVAIIGGGNFFEKAAALYTVSSICDGLVFVGNMAFELLNALGVPVPMKLVDKRTTEEALRVIQYTKARSISILLPKDFWCKNDHIHAQVEIFPAGCIPECWSPVDVGPDSLEEIASLLSICKKILWIGPVLSDPSYQSSSGTSKLAQMLNARSQENCDVTVVGDVACNALTTASHSQPACHMIKNLSVVWEYLKGRNLPGLMALDRLASSLFCNICRHHLMSRR